MIHFHCHVHNKLGLCETDFKFERKLFTSVDNFLDIHYGYTGWPKKLSHYHESSLNRIKPAIKARFFINFDYKMSTII